MSATNRENFLRFTIQRIIRTLPQFDVAFVEGVEALLPYVSHEYLEDTYKRLKEIEKVNQEFLNTLSKEDIKALLMPTSLFSHTHHE